MYHFATVYPNPWWLNQNSETSGTAYIASRITKFWLRIPYNHGEVAWLKIYVSQGCSCISTTGSIIEYWSLWHNLHVKWNYWIKFQIRIPKYLLRVVWQRKMYPNAFSIAQPKRALSETSGTVPKHVIYVPNFIFLRLIVLAIILDNNTIRTVRTFHEQQNVIPEL